METTEQANAFLSRAANTTKYMTAGHRVDALTDLILDYNQAKHHRMPDHLVKRMNAATSRLSELRRELDAKLRECGAASSQVEAMVAELRTLAASLSGRESRSDGPDLWVAVEALSDSIRARSACIRNEADTAKKRSRARKLLTQDREKLKRLLLQYEDDTGVRLSMQEVEEGRFPWDPASLSATNLELTTRRALADLYMRVRRSEEEQVIVREEMKRLLASSSMIREQLSSKLQVSHSIISRAVSSQFFSENKIKTKHDISGRKGIVYVSIFVSHAIPDMVTHPTDSNPRIRLF